MNRTLKNTLIIAAAVAVIGLIMAIVGFVLGGMQSISVSADGINLTTKDNSHSRFNQTYTGVTSIDVKVDLRDVILREGSELKVESKGVGKNFKAENKNGTLLISEGGSGGFSFNIIGFVGNNKGHSDLIITYPANTKFEDINIESDSGEINVSDMQTSKLILYADMGSVNLNNIHANYLDTKLDSGNLSLKKVNAKKHDFHLDMGSLDAAEYTGGKIQGELSSGDADLSGIVTGPVDIYSDMGNVDLNLIGSENQYSYDLYVDMGDINLNGQKSDSTLTKVYENKPVIKINSDSGDINIKFRKNG